MLIPVSAVIATRNRVESLKRTLRSVAAETVLPSELIVVDASSDAATERLCISGPLDQIPTRYVKSTITGAAAQRNIGTDKVSQPFIWFLDDDVIVEPDCLGRLWEAIQSDDRIGGVSAMIVNQCYEPPGFISRTVFTIMHGRREKSFAGRVIGPAIHLLPEDRDDLPEVVPVEWLNTTCTMYRRGALPAPPFDAFFSGYSLMEDLALSLEVGKTWRLANARTARIFHDSQPGEHKSVMQDIAHMGTVNRFYVMTNVLNRRRPIDLAKFALFHLFGTLSIVRKPWLLISTIKGQLTGIAEIRRRWKSEVTMSSRRATQRQKASDGHPPDEKQVF